MPFAPVSHCAASWLSSVLLDGPPRELAEAARTRMSVHYETGDERAPVLTLSTPGAVRLPSAVVTAVLPGPGPVSVGAGQLRQGASCWRVTRWWRPERPCGLEPPDHDVSFLRPRVVPVDVPLPDATCGSLRPTDLIGLGPGLTPAGDDLVAGALVAARATGDPRQAAWRAATLRALDAGRTTAVSRALLHHACDGYATLELAGFLHAVCSGRDASTAAARLVAVGHTSGLALMLGALHTLTTHRLQGAA